MQVNDQFIPVLRRMLIIESETLIHGLFEAILADVVGVDIACTLNEALEQIRQQSYDVVLIGLGPHTQALLEPVVLDQLRSIESRVDVPVIAVTTQVGREERRRLLENGFDGFVPKPFTRETLLEGIIEAF